jgi:hypothetical protein
LVAKARELVPLLRAEAAHTEEQGSLADKSAAALRDAGFFTLFAPRRLGGHEADLRTAVDVFAELARGCGSSGWVAMLLSTSSYFVSLLGGQAALDVWEQDSGAAVCESSAMTGQARPVPGVVVSGRWQPVSGVRQAHWLSHWLSHPVSSPLRKWPKNRLVLHVPYRRRRTARCAPITGGPPLHRAEVRTRERNDLAAAGSFQDAVAAAHHVRTRAIAWSGMLPRRHEKLDSVRVQRMADRISTLSS